MGRMVDGAWLTESEWADSDGEFRRSPTVFHGRVEDGGTHAPAAGRYHLYVSLACPWAHRTLIMRALKGLEDAVSVSVVHPLMMDDGWTFEAGDGVVPDTVNHTRLLREVYVKADPSYTGRVTVPVLWDKVLGRLVSNESSEIIRDFNGPMSAVSATPQQAVLDFYPEALRPQIDAINTRVYETVNNGVYRSGFSTSQAAYARAVEALFASLEWLEGILSSNRYLVGNTITEADWRLFTTLLRFDPVYVGHFKCNLRRIVDYPNLDGYLRELYQWPGVAQTCNMVHIKAHYYRSHRSLNPSGVVPVGPVLELDRPHGRGGATRG